MRPRPSPIATVVSVILIVGLVSPVGAEPTSTAAGPDQAPEGALSAGQVMLRHIDNGLVNPLGVVNARDHTNRLFVLEQRGTVRIVKNGNVQSGFFLNLLDGVPGGVRSGGELDSSDSPSTLASTRTATCSCTTRAATATLSWPSSAANTDKTRVPLPRTNGSCGSSTVGAEPQRRPAALRTGRATSTSSPATAAVGATRSRTARTRTPCSARPCRIAPDLNGGYSTPSSNPYDGSKPGLDEIWASGSATPWRASFDRETDGLWIADVGQGAGKRSTGSAADAAGRNYGWDCREGFHACESTRLSPE